MKADKPTTQTYTIQATLRLQLTVDIQAQSLEAALESAKQLKEKDFCTILGDYYDGEMEITGLSRQ